jgi:hypothetical protein
LLKGISLKFLNKNLETIKTGILQIKKNSGTLRDQKLSKKFLQES